MKKLFLCSILTFSLLGFTFADRPFFSGFAGFYGNMKNEADRSYYSPDLTSEVFFSGLFDFNGKFFIRSNFYVYGTDIFDSTLFTTDSEDKNALFRVEELSGTLKFNAANSSHYFTAFIGEYEPIGSDLFLQRHFGISPLNSSITKSWHHLSGTNVYPFYAFGLSYTIHPQSNFAFGISGYKNKANGDTEDSHVNTLNFDFRVASVFDLITFDIVTGLALPFENKSTDDEDVILMLRKILIHTGFNILLGRHYDNCLYLQGGFRKITVNPSDSDDKVMEFKDIYVLMEERMHLAKTNVNCAQFIIPVENAIDMIYLRSFVTKKENRCGIIGANLNIESKDLFIGTSQLILGIHATVGFITEGNGFEGALDKAVCFTPYGNIPIPGGEVHTSIAFSIFDMNTLWLNGIQLAVGFKTTF